MKDYKDLSGRIASLQKEVDVALQQMYVKNHSFATESYSINSIKKQEMQKPLRIKTYTKEKRSIHFHPEIFLKQALAGILGFFELLRRHKKFVFIALGSIVILPTLLFGINFIKDRIIAGSNKAKVKSYSFVGDVHLQKDIASMNKIGGMGGKESEGELQFFFYKVKQGENIVKISKKLGVSMDSLISLNEIQSVNQVKANDQILVPNIEGIIYTVHGSETLQTIAKNFKIDISDIQDANDLDGVKVAPGDVIFLPGAKLSASERAKVLGYLFMKPIRGRYTSGFGIRRDPFTGKPAFHAGIDIAAPSGTSIKSTKEGTVEYAGWDGGYGKVVKIKHPNGYTSIYGHMSRILVSEGQWVQGGSTIGRVGSTGRSTGPHLHFEMRKNERPTNPTQFSGLAKSSKRWY